MRDLPDTAAEARTPGLPDLSVVIMERLERMERALAACVAAGADVDAINLYDEPAELRILTHMSPSVGEAVVAFLGGAETRTPATHLAGHLINPPLTVCHCGDIAVIIRGDVTRTAPAPAPRGGRHLTIAVAR